jgi:hypothetical protein
MQTREQRDEKTVVIATALALFGLVVAIGVLVLSAAVVFLELSGEAASALVYVFACAGGMVLVVHLVSARRRGQRVDL